MDDDTKFVLQIDRVFILILIPSTVRQTYTVFWTSHDVLLENVSSLTVCWWSHKYMIVSNQVMSWCWEALQAIVTGTSIFQESYFTCCFSFKKELNVLYKTRKIFFNFEKKLLSILCHAFHTLLLSCSLQENCHALISGLEVERILETKPVHSSLQGKRKTFSCVSLPSPPLGFSHQHLFPPYHATYQLLALLCSQFC